MRKLVVAALLLLLTVVPVVAQALYINIDHHVHGVVGSLATSWLTVLTSDNKVVQIMVPGNFRMPNNVQAGKTVHCTYIVSNSNTFVLTRIKASNSTGTRSQPVTNVLPE